MSRKGHPIHNAPKRRREPDDSDPDSDHEISHFHDPLEDEESKKIRVEVISERRNILQHANKKLGRKHLDDTDIIALSLKGKDEFFMRKLD